MGASVPSPDSSLWIFKDFLLSIGITLHIPNYSHRSFPIISRIVTSLLILWSLLRHHYEIKKVPDPRSRL